MRGTKARGTALVAKDHSVVAQALAGAAGRSRSITRRTPPGVFNFGPLEDGRDQEENWDCMRFTLVYRGRIPASGAVAQIEAIRRDPYLQAQYKALYGVIATTYSTDNRQIVNGVRYTGCCRSAGYAQWSSFFCEQPRRRS